MTDQTLSEVVGSPIYYRYRHVAAYGATQDLVVFVDAHEATVSIEGGKIVAAAGLPVDEIRKLAGALLDAADAIENAKRTGFVKQKQL